MAEETRVAEVILRKVGDKLVAIPSHKVVVLRRPADGFNADLRTLAASLARDHERFGATFTDAAEVPTPELLDELAHLISWLDMKARTEDSSHAEQTQAAMVLRDDSLALARQLGKKYPAIRQLLADRCPTPRTRDELGAQLQLLGDLFQENWVEARTRLHVGEALLTNLRTASDALRNDPQSLTDVATTLNRAVTLARTLGTRVWTAAQFVFLDEPERLVDYPAPVLSKGYPGKSRPQPKPSPAPEAKPAAPNATPAEERQPNS